MSYFIAHLVIKKEKVITLLRKINKEQKEELDHLVATNVSITLEKDNLSAQLKTSSQTHDCIRRLAFTDYLTDLPNRIAFTDFLENVLLTLREGKLIAILDLDLDDFSTIDTRLELQVDLLKAVEEAQFLIYYQPMVRLSDNKIDGFESLVRW